MDVQRATTGEREQLDKHPSAVCRLDSLKLGAKVACFDRMPVLTLRVRVRPPLTRVGDPSSRPIRSLVNAAANATGFFNDIVSYRKCTKLEGELNNGVLVVQRFLDCECLRTSLGRAGAAMRRT